MEHEEYQECFEKVASMMGTQKEGDDFGYARLVAAVERLTEEIAGLRSELARQSQPVEYRFTGATTTSSSDEVIRNLFLMGI